MNFGPECGTSTKEGKLYQKRVLSTMAIYMAVLLGASRIVRHGHPAGWHLYFWAVAPAIPVISLIVYMGVYLRDETDEYMRMVTMRSLLAGTAAVLGTLVVSDFLRAFTPSGTLPPFACFVLFFVSFAIAQGYQQLQNRGERAMTNRLRELRAERNWSQAHLAEMLEVSRQSVNAIETGKYDPSLPLAFRIARLFKLPIEAIFSDDA